MLLSIALLPLLAPRFWHHHFAKVSAAWAVAFAAPFVLRFGGAALHELLHMALVDYVPFVILIATLFTIGGGIYVRGSLRGSPWVNAAIIAVGIFLASWVGTTGSAMVTVRPLLRANRARRYRAHTLVFFTFLVANIGGALTPLGDPPLFLGFLHGVPFFWTFGLWKPMLFVCALVLGVYLAVDLVCWRRETPEARAGVAGVREPLRIEGAHNLVLLLGVLAGVIVSGVWPGPEIHVLGVPQRAGNLARDAVLLAMLLLSWWTTSAAVREANEYSWAPIREVAILFAGIFVTIIPALAMLRVGEQGGMAAVVEAVREPVHFFWASGALSSFLDNAPTYLAFLNTALGRLFPGVRGIRRRPPPDRRAPDLPRCHLGRLGLHGCQHLHRKRAQLHGEVDRRGKRGAHAVVLRLHSALQPAGPDPDVRHHGLGILRVGDSSWPNGT